MTFRGSDAAGVPFLEYSATHAGLGIWDTTTDKKFTVQFVSTNFVGALLPVLTPVAGTNSGYIQWNNSGMIVYSDTMQSSDWLSSLRVATGTGVAYADLVSYLQVCCFSWHI